MRQSLANPRTALGNRVATPLFLHLQPHPESTQAGANRRSQPLNESHAGQRRVLALRVGCLPRPFRPHLARELQVNRCDRVHGILLLFQFVVLTIWLYYTTNALLAAVTL